jgi:quercetin dioxygenase-like cupin family protein
MKRTLFVGGLLCAGILIGLISSQLLPAQPAGYSTKIVYRTDLANLPGQEAIFYASDWPPGFRLPWHVHPEGHEFVYVMEGEQTFG